MAHDFGAENLEDGEQWLPSDFFSIDEVQASNKTSIPLSYCSSSKPSCMAVFHNSSASASPHRHPHNRCLSKPPPNSQVHACMTIYAFLILSVFLCSFFFFFNFLWVYSGLSRRFFTGLRRFRAVVVMLVIPVNAELETAGPVAHRFIGFSA